MCDESGKPVGVEVLTSFDPDAPEDDGSNTPMRYEKPTMTEEEIKDNVCRMSENELRCLFENLPEDGDYSELNETIGEALFALQFPTETA